jgi:hypothetical protein
MLNVKIDAETGIWSLDAAKIGHKFDPILAARLSMLYSPRTTADLGCGDGKYCRALRGFGWKTVHGYEGTKNIKNLEIYDEIFETDLSKPLGTIIPYQFVLCLEVGEHIPEKHEQVFLNNICKFIIKDLVLSWAIPGHGGLGHFNEKPNEYIIEQLSNRGLKFDKSMSVDLRNFSILPWFKETIMVFAK